MQIKNGSLGYTLTLDNKQVQQILAQTRADFARTSDYATAELNKVQSSMSNLAVLGGTFLSVSAAKDFITQLVQVRGEFEQTEISFRTMLQSQEKSTALMSEMVELAKNTPMQFSEVTQGAKQLLAYQVEAEKLTETLEMLGNISSGLSVPISRLILVYGQVRAKGRLMGDDLRQFTEAGVPMIAMIAKNMGVAQSAVADMVSEGKVGFKEVEKVLQDLTSQGGLFYNMMEEQSKTIPGQIAKLQDEIEVMFNEIGKDSQGFITSVIGGVSTLVSNYEALGKTLGILISTYGAYKAAVIVADIANTTEANMVKNRIDGLRTNNSITAKRIILEYDQANAALNSAKAEEIASRAVVKSSRENLNALTIDREKALAKLNAADKARTAADIEVAAAQKQVNVYKDSIYVGKQREAQQRLEEATIKRNALTKDVNTASTEYNTVAEKTNTASKTLNANVSDLQSKKQAVAVATKNADTAATTRLTFAQKLNIAWTELATVATNAWNASLLSNPIVFVVAAIGTLVATYFILRDTTTSAQRAQEAYNKAQEEVKSKLDETKKKADEYINTLKDETATVYQQIQAYNALQALKLKGLENLTQEQIATMDLTELRKLLNASYDDQSLTAQENELKRLEIERSNLLKEIEERTKNSSAYNFDNSKALAEAKKKLDDINYQYDIQLNSLNKLKTDQQLANAPLRDRAQYWEDEIKKIEDAIAENERLNFGVKSTNPLIKDNTDAANIFKVALQSANITPLLGQLEEAKKQFSAVTSEMSGLNIAEEIKDKSYYDKYQKLAQSTLDGLDLNDPKNFDKIKSLRTIIEGTTNALKKYNVESSKPKKPKTPKKADDPVEIFKKQVNGIKEQYDRYVEYMNTDDIILRESAKIINSSLTSKGANYEEYLRNVQKQLANVTNKTKVQIKQLQFVNDELAKVIDYNAFDKYKEGINEQIDSSDKLLDIIEKVQQEKQKFANSTDQIEIDKFKFLDEKQVELIKKVNEEAKNLLDTLSKEANPLKAINDSFDNQLLLLKTSILNAQDEINKLTDQNNTLDSSDPDTEDTRVKNEQKILKLKNKQLEAQNLIDYNEKKRTKEVKENPTDNADYNQLLKQYQDFETKKKNIEEEYDGKLTTVRDERIELQNNKKLQANQTLLDQMLAQNTATENEIEKQKKDAISKITLEQFKNSELYMKMVLGDLDRMSSQTMQDIINGFDEALRNPEIGGKMNLEEFKVIEDRIKEMKEKLSQNGYNPFQALQNNFAIFKENFEKGFTDIDGKLDFKNIGGMVQGLKGGLNESIKLVEGLGIDVSDTTKDSIKLGLDLFEAGTQIAQGIMTGNPKDILAGLYKGVSAIINARKKARESERKAQEELKKYQNEIFSAQLEYNKLLRDRELIEARINDLYVSRIQNIHEEKNALSQSLKSVVQDQQNIFNRLLNAETVTDKTTKKKGGFLGVGKKTVVVEHKSTVAKLLGLQQGAQLTDEIFEKLERLNAQKPLTGDAKDAYEQLKKVREEYGSIDDAMKQLEIDLKNALTGTTAQNIADSIIDGLKSGKSSFADFAEDVEGFLRNAIISGMSAKIIEPEMQKLQDALADMMGDGILTDEEKKRWQEMYTRVAQDAQDYFDMIDQAGLGMSNIKDPNQNSLSGAIKGMSEQEANIMSGHLNATRILTKNMFEALQEANKQRDLSNKTLLQQLDRLANIDYNTRSVLPLLEKLINRIDNAGRAYGF